MTKNIAGSAAAFAFVAAAIVLASQSSCEQEQCITEDQSCLEKACCEGLHAQTESAFSVDDLGQQNEKVLSCLCQRAESEQPAAKGPCINGAPCEPLSPPAADKLDMLFVVDNTESMGPSQSALVKAVPQLFSKVTSGAIRELHAGVVSTDMWVVAGMIPGCRPEGGDDGRLQAHSSTKGCDMLDPPFLSFGAGYTDPVRLERDFACIAELGTTGCTIEQPLEAALKALWPSVYHDKSGKLATSPVTFLATTPDGQKGHADVPISAGGNLGFLHEELSSRSSAVAVVVLTDDEDCSLKNPNVFIQPDPNESANLRCFRHPESLYDLNRYVIALPMLRQAKRSLVSFSVIAGVPPDLVAPEVLATTDFSAEGPRTAFYDKILRDQRMREVVDPQSSKLKPSCEHAAPSGREMTAYPPRRLVEVAKSFGQLGTVQSICVDDLGPGLDVIGGAIAKTLQTKCLPHRLTRSADGRVKCDVIWILPKPDATSESTPTDCSELPFLANVNAPRPKHSEDGETYCLVSQLRVGGAEVPDGAGWFYDDFSTETESCSEPGASTITFTQEATPPRGVVSLLDCAPEA